MTRQVVTVPERKGMPCLCGPLGEAPVSLKAEEERELTQEPLLKQDRASQLRTGWFESFQGSEAGGLSLILWYLALGGIKEGGV